MVLQKNNRIYNVMLSGAWCCNVRNKNKRNHMIFSMMHGDIKKAKRRNHCQIIFSCCMVRQKKHKQTKSISYYIFMVHGGTKKQQAKSYYIQFTTALWSSLRRRRQGRRQRQQTGSILNPRQLYRPKYRYPLCSSRSPDMKSPDMKSFTGRGHEKERHARWLRQGGQTDSILNSRQL